MTNSKVFEKLEKMCEKVLKVVQQFELILICNTRSKTKSTNGINISMANEHEFFSDEEFSEVFRGIAASGLFYIRTYYNEIDFIRDFVEGHIDQKNSLIYNLARNGNSSGKKSLIPSLLSLLHTPYTGSNSFVISLCREKYIYSSFLSQQGFPVPETFLYLGNGEWMNNKIPTHGIYIIKAVNESASIGLTASNVITIQECEDFDFEKRSGIFPPFLVQQFIDGTECEVPLLHIGDLGMCALDPVGLSIENDSQILSYDISQRDAYGFYMLEKTIDPSICKEIKEISEKVAKTLGMSNYGRIDFRISSEKKPYIIDIAASPYTTKHSSFAYTLERDNIEYHNLYKYIICDAFNTFIEKEKSNQR